MKINSDEKIFHLKGLNGLRAIAAIVVVFSHTGQALGEFGLAAKKDGIFLASFGVSIFFSLSGFLITTLLLIEKKEFAGINIRQFYIRRILRIWPLYYFYLLLSFGALYFFFPGKLPGSSIFYILLCANIPFITNTTLPLIYHYWSIGVEEQFYIFWPWVVKNVSKLFTFLVWFVAILMTLKLFLWIFFKKTGIMWPLEIVHVTRFHCMAIGAMGGILYLNGNKLIRAFSYSLYTQIICWLFIVLAAFNLFRVGSVIDDEVTACITVILIFNVSANAKSIIKLNFPLLNYLGKISYGIYVYHPLLIFFIGKLFASVLLSLNVATRYVAVYILITGITILVAGLSYWLLERRFLKLKFLYSRVLSSGSR
ncbi:MAG: acyltransferase [Bacteroidota bacterium]